MYFVFSNNLASTPPWKWKNFVDALNLAQIWHEIDEPIRNRYHDPRIICKLQLTNVWNGAERRSLIASIVSCQYSPSADPPLFVTFHKSQFKADILRQFGDK